MFSLHQMSVPVTPVRQPLKWLITLAGRGDEAEEEARDVVPGEARGWFGQSVVFPPGYVDGRTIAVVEHPEGELFPTLSASVRQAAEVLWYDSLDAAVPITRRDQGSEYIFIVDIDTFRSVATAFTQLQRFRESHPRIPVVMASRHFQRNDFSSERRILADASVQIQSGSIAVALAIASAIENHCPARANIPPVFQNRSRIVFRHRPAAIRATA
jgi:hypothetical protein